MITKTLPINEVRRVMSVSRNIDKKIAWHTTEIMIRQMISIDEFIDVVHNILEACVDADGEPDIDLLDFYIRIGIIKAYARMELPNDIVELYDIAYSSGIYERICSISNSGQVSAIKDTVLLYFK